MYKIAYSSKFKRDFKKLLKSGRFKVEKFDYIVNILAQGKKLPSNYRDHSLSGRLADARECHITPDLLLVYKIMDDVMVIYMVRISSHSELGF